MYAWRHQRARGLIVNHWQEEAEKERGKRDLLRGQCHLNCLPCLCIAGVNLMYGLFNGCYSGGAILDPYYLVAPEANINRSW